MYSVLNTVSNINTFTYQKALLHTLFSLFLKSSKVFSVSLGTMDQLLPLHWQKASTFVHIKNLLYF